MVAIRGALGQHTLPVRSICFDVTEFSHAKVGRGVPTASGLERAFSTIEEAKGGQGAI
jgi:hypothetical protein